MTQPDTWFVAFGPDKAVKTNDSATSAVRSTRTFKSEIDAKLFAMQILSKGWSATAGTPLDSSGHALRLGEGGKGNGGDKDCNSEKSADHVRS